MEWRRIVALNNDQWNGGGLLPLIMINGMEALDPLHQMSYYFFLSRA
jgi:hypothetical protein